MYFLVCRLVALYMCIYFLISGNSLWGRVVPSLHRCGCTFFSFRLLISVYFKKYLQVWCLWILSLARLGWTSPIFICCLFGWMWRWRWFLVLLYRSVSQYKIILLHLYSHLGALPVAYEWLVFYQCRNPFFLRSESIGLNVLYDNKRFKGILCYFKLWCD